MSRRFLAALALLSLTVAQTASAKATLVRGSILHFVKDPAFVPEAESYQYFEDGYLYVREGKVLALGPASDLATIDLPPDVMLEDYRGSLIVPGFIDTHIHYPQTEMIASYGEQLLEWLNTYTFPTELQFRNKEHATRVSKIFLEELLRNGTTSALVFGTVHPESVDAFFEESQKLNLRMIAGKVLMDRFAPEGLLDTPETAYSESRELIERWHGKDRLQYAVTPRFAITSTEEQLAQAGRLLKEFPGTYMHTHLSENQKEIESVLGLFPGRESYLGVYDEFGLLGPTSIFAHGVHLTETDFQRLSETGSSISFCPTSNLFLGSGLFNLEAANDPERPVKVGLGTDVGAGTSFSMLQTMNEAYKVTQLRGRKLSAFQALYLATMGSARTLSIDDKVGNFELGKEADFVVLDPAATPLMKLRSENSRTLMEKLFVLMMLGDDRAIRATYIMGEPAYRR